MGLLLLLGDFSPPVKFAVLSFPMKSAFWGAWWLCVLARKAGRSKTKGLVAFQGAEQLMQASDGGHFVSHLLL